MVIQGTSIYIVIKLIYYGIYMLHTSLQCHHISKYHGIAVLIQHIYIVFTHLPLFLDMFPKPQTRLEQKNDRFTSKPTGLLVLVSGKTLQAKSLPVVFLGLKATIHTTADNTFISAYRNWWECQHMVGHMTLTATFSPKSTTDKSITFVEILHFLSIVKQMWLVYVT